MKLKTLLMSREDVRRSIIRIAHEIVEKNKGVHDLCLVGILRRGVPIANEIARRIQEIEGVSVPVGVLDISLYRDDISELSDQPTVNDTKIDFDITGKTIVLVDDVLYTGRTTRAAMDALIALGRPAKINLAVLVDRGHRELPICANYVGKSFPTSKTEMIKVSVEEYDHCTQIDLYEL